jgi:hypothetical protein
VTNRHYVHKRPIKPPFPADIGEAPPFFYAEDYHQQLREASTSCRRRCAPRADSLPRRSHCSS